MFPPPSRDPWLLVVPSSKQHPSTIQRPAPADIPRVRPLLEDGGGGGGGMYSPVALLPTLRPEQAAALLDPAPLGQRGCLLFPTCFILMSPLLARPEGSCLFVKFKSQT